MTEIELRAWAIEHICPDAGAELLDWVINGFNAAPIGERK